MTQWPYRNRQSASSRVLWRPEKEPGPDFVDNAHEVQQPAVAPTVPLRPDLESFATAAKRVAIQQRIIGLKREAEMFKRDCRAPYDHVAEKFLPLDQKIIKAAQAQGHRVDWQPLPPYSAKDVAATYNALLEEIRVAEQEAAALEGDAR